MSTPIKIQAAIFCGGNHVTGPVSLIVPLGDKKRRQYDDYAEGYALGKGWTVREGRGGDLYARMFEAAWTPRLSSNDWRCPTCSKAVQS